MREWLPQDHLVWFVIDMVAELDLSRFRVRRTPAGSAAGRASYDPQMLLTLLVYAYACGEYSSRRIERSCADDVAYRVICAQDAPDHCTIARFRRTYFADGRAMEDLFGQVLVLAARSGLGRLGLVAVDGTKIMANASKDASRTEQTLRKLAAGLLEQAEQTDAAEDELFGPGLRGDEMPPELADPVSRRSRIKAALKQLEDERRAEQDLKDTKIAEYLQKQADGVNGAGAPPLGAELAAAQARLDTAIARHQARIKAHEEKLAAALAAGHKGLPGPDPARVEEHSHVRKGREAVAKAQAKIAERQARQADKPTPQPKRNITDPDSRFMPVRGGGFVQGYNSQAIYSADGLTLGTMVTQDTGDVHCYQPMISKAIAAGRLIRRHTPTATGRAAARIGKALADAGYLSNDNLTAPGPDRLIATGKHHTLQQARTADPDPADDPPEPIQQMARRLTTPDGITTYRRRSPLAEGPFGDLKHNRRFRRYTMRGLATASGEWTFVHTIRNLLKIRQTTPQATSPAPA